MHSISCPKHNALGRDGPKVPTHACIICFSIRSNTSGKSMHSEPMHNDATYMPSEICIFSAAEACTLAAACGSRPQSETPAIDSEDVP